MRTQLYILQLSSLLLSLPLLAACSSQENPAGSSAVPEGMVEIRPVLPGAFSPIPRDPDEADGPASRKYDSNEVTGGKLGNTVRLPAGSTVWLLARQDGTGAFVKNSYVVFNPDTPDDPDDGSFPDTYLVPCNVDDDGSVKDMEGSPLFLKDNTKYRFYAVSPARKLDDEKLREGQIALKLYNGEYLYANDCRYDATTPGDLVTITQNNEEAVQVIELKPMINQTAELRLRVSKGDGVHDLDIQPSGVQISGLQNDEHGIDWHMSMSVGDEPIKLKHGDKNDSYNNHDYKIDENGYVNVNVPVLPMHSISNPILVVLRLKINGVPSSYSMMLNEKDFKAGYSYGYSGIVSIPEGIDVITWQYVSWETPVEMPDPKETTPKQ